MQKMNKADNSHSKKFYERDVIRILIVAVAAFILAINLKSFVWAGNLVPGGLSGITVLLQRVAARYFNMTIPYAQVYLVLNAGPIILSLKYLGKKFTIYSIIMIILSSFFTDLLPHITITYELPLIAIFGGLINGAVISICLFANATSGGLDFIAVFLSEKKGIDAWSYILIFNALTIGISGYLFGWDTALYSIIFQFTSTQVVQTLYRKYKQNTILIITEKPMEVYESIRKGTHHDATLFTGKGCYKKEERTMVYSVVSGDEVRKVTNLIREVDEAAFINVIRTEQIGGRFYHRPNE